MSVVKRALISVSDKSGLLPLAQGLRALGVEIISTGGTAKLLREEKIPVREIADFTGFPEIMDGRVKTLHPKVHGGILARRSSPEHRRQAKRLGIRMIDLVVVNLYPFERAASRNGAPLPELIEQIDIGGVSLLRSAAKNFESVAVLSSPAQYPAVLAELRAGRGRLSEHTRFRLAAEAFAHTAYYDTMIRQALAHRLKPSDMTPDWPDKLTLVLTKKQTLRYGENPHQAGAWYGWLPVAGGHAGLSDGRQLHGKELSFNNLLDMDAAIQLAAAFRKPCAVVVKHMNPCGAACGPDLARAFKAAFAGDPLSAFGGIVGFNRRVDGRAARALIEAGFLECVVATGFTPEALELLNAKKNLRLIEVPEAALRRSRPVDIKQVEGGLLLQEPDALRVPPARWRRATRAKPTPAQLRDLVFAWTVCKFVRSNAIVIVKDQQVVGVGAGQMSRVDSVRIALRKAGKRAKGAVLASDGFFPKPDGPAAAVRAGIRAIVQPGGSVQDPAVVAVADKAHVPMLLTGERHFKH